MPGKSELHCLCRRPEEGFMICCDKCNVWFHYRCVDLTESKARKYDVWFCITCNIAKLERENGELNILIRKHVADKAKLLSEVMDLKKEKLESLKKEMELLALEKQSLKDESSCTIVENDDINTRLEHNQSKRRQLIAEIHKMKIRKLEQMQEEILNLDAEKMKITCYEDPVNNNVSMTPPLPESQNFPSSQMQMQDLEQGKKQFKPKPSRLSVSHPKLKKLNYDGHKD